MPTHDRIQRVNLVMKEMDKLMEPKFEKWRRNELITDRIIYFLYFIFFGYHLSNFIIKF